MQRTAFFALLCAVCVGSQGFVLPAVAGPREVPGRFLMKGKVGTFSLARDQNEPRDWLADLIWYLLNLTVGAFLDMINTHSLTVTNSVEAGRQQLEEAMKDLDASLKEQIREIRDKTLVEVLLSFEIFLQKLGRVLPSLTGVPLRADPNDIIYAILGITLEQFLQEINSGLLRIDTLLGNTEVQLRNVASNLGDTPARHIILTQANKMAEGKATLKPTLNNLREILPDRAKIF